MGWALDPLPAALLVWFGLLFCLAFAILSRTFAKGSRLALLLAASFGVVSLWGAVSSFAVPESWRMQTFVERLIELPVVATFAVLCFIQARRMPGSEERLKRILRMGPPLIVGAWVLALVGEQIWPQPILDPFARMPVGNLALLAILCILILTYQWILAYVFFRVSRSSVATRRLKAQNLCVAAGISVYTLSAVNVVAGYAFQTFMPNPLLREITLVQFAIEDRLLAVWAIAFLAALILAGGAYRNSRVDHGRQTELGTGFVMSNSCATLTLLLRYNHIMDTKFAEEASYVRDVGHLSDRDIARATGAGVSTVGAWMRRTRTPTGRRAERLAELSATVERLARVMESEYIPIWVRKPIAALDDEKPLDVLAKGDYRRLSRLISELESPTFS